MADPRKPTNSSMFDLKAELYRKQEEYKQLKAQKTSDFVKAVKTSRPGKGDKIWNKQNAGVLQRADKDLAEKEEEDNVFERSRKALEAKTKIYDKIASASGIPEEDGSEGFLVDFQRKAIDRIVEERRGQEMTGAPTSATPVRKESGDHQDDSEEDVPSDEPAPPPANPEEEWVDYVDTFERSRRCMKKDLPQMQEQERPLGRPAGNAVLQLKEGATLMSADMKRELRRQQWEKEAQESANGPVHYANVQFDEIRTHGTGFYQFSKDSNLRDEQMQMLNKLREQTMDGLQRSERIKEKRKAALEARLAKVKQRRKMKDGAGLLGSDHKEMEEDKKEEEQKTGAEDPTPKEPEPLTRDDSWRRSAPVREWDIGKEKLPEWNAKRYMEQRRTERESEFAPPLCYFDQKTTVAVTNPRRHGASSRNTGSQNGAGRTQNSQPSSPSPSSSTDAMLKHIRQSIGTVPSHTQDNRADVEDSRVDVEDIRAVVDLAAIPVPEMGTASERVYSSACDREKRKWEAGEDSKTGAIPHAQASSAMGHVHVPSPMQPAGQQQPLVFGGPVPDVSVPPPGYPTQPQMVQQQTGMASPAQSGPPSFTASSSHQEASVGKPFMYPSQQGLLMSQPQPTPSPPISLQPFEFKKPATVARTAVPKVSMVDKRFMQNREVSDEDLLGYMAQSSADPLTKIQAVSYTPGLFCSATGPQLPDTEPTAETSAQTTTRPAAQTKGVIFGVPDFLQPATVTATSYQPGSFMAAKEAAAQRAEEEIEAARKKTQYSSAPVLYGRDNADPWELEDQGSHSIGKEEESSVAQEAEDTDEYARFIIEVKGGQ